MGRAKCVTGSRRPRWARASRRRSSTTCRSTLRRSARRSPTGRASDGSLALGSWLSLTEVQNVPLIVFDRELSGTPRGLVHILHEGHISSSQCICGGGDALGVEIEVEMLAPIHKRDGGVGLVDELEMEELPARANARVEVLVLELERETERLG